MKIRRADVQESELLSRIAREAKAHWGYRDEDLAAWQADLTVSRESLAALPTFVAELAGEIAGFVQLSAESGALELEHLWVRPAHMGKGIGRGLLECAVAQAASAGFAEIHIDADPHAEPFYIACGAVRIGAKLAPIAGQALRARPQLVLSARANRGSANVSP